MKKHESSLTVAKTKWIRWLLLMLILQLSGCAAEKAYRRAQDAATRGEWDRAVGEYIVAMNKDPKQAKYRSGFERARLAASQFHQQKAKQLIDTKNYEQAIIELQIALNFDPTNQFISNELEKARIDYENIQNQEKLTAIEQAKEDAKKNMQLYKVLGPEAETTIPSLRFHDDSLKHILDALGQLAGINVVYDSDFRDQEFSVSLDNIKFKDALEQIMVANHLYYKPLDQSTILIVPDNPQKRRQYDEQVIQTFYLSNAEINDVLNLIRSVMQIQRVATNPQLNAITLRDTPDKIAIAQRIIEANDKSRSEVLLDVEILEVDRMAAMRYGIDLSAYSVTQELVVNETPGQIFGNQFSALDAASWRFTVPAISYNALSSDQHTKVLAKPQIRASEGQQVTVRLGDRVPIPVTVFQSIQPGQNILTPTTTFQLTDVGINIDVTPRVHHNREVTLNLRFELTSIAVPGIGAQPPTLGNRTVNTVIRLKDGETNLLAGLVRRDERKSLRSVPGVDKIPIVRELFASNDKSTEERDIIFTITPHILRTPKITPEDLSPIWIGTEDAVRLKAAPPLSVFDNRQMEKPVPPGTEAANVAEGTVSQPAPGLASPQQVPTDATKKTPPVTQNEEKPPASVIPESEIPTQNQVPQQQSPPAGATKPPAAQTAPSEPPGQNQPTVQTVPSVVPPVTEKSVSSEPGQGETTISFLSPNVNPSVGTDIVLHLKMENASAVANGTLFLSFDPAVVQVKDIMQGSFVSSSGFSKSFDNSRGTININAARTPVGDSGIAATIILQGKKRVPPPSL